MIASARELLRTGQPLTVQAVADQAQVSRATAYRYFANNDTVAMNAMLPLQDDPMNDPSWPYFRPDPDADLPTRVAGVVRSIGEWAFDHEMELRTLLALSLQPDAEQKGLSRRDKLRRQGYIDVALRDLPDTVDPQTRHRLSTALLALFGSDAIVWTTDIGGLDRDEAIDLLAWTAHTLVTAVLQAPRHNNLALPKIQ